MEIIQTSVKKREGRKWKQRWVVLKKASLKLSPDVYHYLFIYKDASHAKEGKEKYVLPLIDFCGLDICRHYDKEENILILVTSSQTVYLSFNQLAERDHWKQTLIDQFGEPITYEICIPDKQRLKAGKATIRLYPSFVSIITNNNYKCLNRWYMNDIQRYSAVDRSHFMFEIISSSKRKGGNVINLLVNNNADDISKAFDSIQLEARPNNNTLVRHGSAMLDELDQAKRNVGDQNFFRRAILRYSERMKKKKRDRSNTAPTKKSESNHNIDSSIQQHVKFQSLERTKNPQISIDLDNDSLLRAIQLKQCQSTSSSSPSPTKEIPPQLPTKRFNHSPESRNAANDISLVSSEGSTADISPIENDPFDASDSAVEIEDGREARTEIPCYKTDKVLDESNSHSEMLGGMNICMATDKSDLSIRSTRRSVDSVLNSNNSAYKNPAKYAIAKTKGVNIKTKIEQTPTPPPRSPVSLGLAPNVFQFPPAGEESLNSAESNEKIENASTPDDLSKVSAPSNCTADNVKMVDEQVLSDMHGSVSPDVKTGVTSSPSFNHSESGGSSKDTYENLTNFQNIFDNTDYAMSHSNSRNRSHNLPCYDPDPLDFEAWSKATGDGRPATSPSDTMTHDADYVNVKSPLSDDDNDSYVNVKRNKPTPLRFGGYQRNDFEKYDDDDSSIYHAFGALDEESENNSLYMNQANGSYENVNGVRASPRNYLNVNKAEKLNYIDLHLGDSPCSKTSLSSPFSVTPSYKTDYTRIDLDATEAIIRSMEQHRQQRDKLAVRTPTRTTR